MPILDDATVCFFSQQGNNLKCDRGTHICKIHLDDGKVVTVVAGVRGYIVDFNEALQKEPDLIWKKPESDGFVAIVNLKWPEKERLKELLPKTSDKLIEEEDGD